MLIPGQRLDLDLGRLIVEKFAIIIHLYACEYEGIVLCVELVADSDKSEVCGRNKMELCALA